MSDDGERRDAVRYRIVRDISPRDYLAAREVAMCANGFDAAFDVEIERLASSCFGRTFEQELHRLASLDIAEAVFAGVSP